MSSAEVSARGRVSYRLAGSMPDKFNPPFHYYRRIADALPPTLDNFFFSGKILIYSNICNCCR